jgi:hypothetical protein
MALAYGITREEYTRFGLARKQAGSRCCLLVNVTARINLEDVHFPLFDKKQHPKP